MTAQDVLNHIAKIKALEAEIRHATTQMDKDIAEHVESVRTIPNGAIVEVIAPDNNNNVFCIGKVVSAQVGISIHHNYTAKDEDYLSKVLQSIRYIVHRQKKDGTYSEQRIERQRAFLPFENARKNEYDLLIRLKQ